MKMLSGIKTSAMLAALLLAAQPQVASGQITIGKDKGIIPTGIMINVYESQPQQLSNGTPHTGLAAIGYSYLSCIHERDLKQINGIWAMPIAPGIGLAPNVSTTVSYVRYSDDGMTYLEETLTGKITPEGSYATTNHGKSITSPKASSNRHWCLSPFDKLEYDGMPARGTKSLWMQGEWMLVTDGTQKTGHPSIPPMSVLSLGGGPFYHPVIPADIPIRVSTLECTINTPATINFGAVEQNFREMAELARVNNHLSVSCTQDAGRGIDTNIHVRLKALSGLHDGNPYRLKLDQGGGYITGFIGNSNYYGTCSGHNGVTFDNAEFKIGEIHRSQLNKTYSHPITWRLCSGGKDLPGGRVTAAAEMMITYD